ncbi:DUF4321 domain-containing protein [Clostridium sp. 19966]|uniref:DUF4321 domain-containing protein n=1 Tax=Clostridium sp. 19966 TaxID=2768166 RepID=UPI0028DDD1AB|nr:DUF4321 domain-containing protein [Clostridium sp. 19966]
MKNTSKSSAFFIFVVLLGAIAGELIGNLFGHNSTLNFLSHVYTIGTTSPIDINLIILEITFGIKFTLNIMSIIGIIVAIIFYKRF